MRTQGNRNVLTTYAASPEARQQLTAEVERDLVSKLQSGDRRAGDRLTRACLPFVLTVALEYRRWGVPLEDILQEGNIGLLKAAMRFDPDRGCRLVTYAAYWIRAEIRDFVVRGYRIVRIGASKAERRALRHYRRTRERDADALAAASGLSRERVVTLLPMLVTRDVDLDAREHEGVPLTERLAHPGPSPEEQVSSSDERCKLSAALRLAVAELPAREQTIIQERWLTDAPLTLEEVGERFGISKERVRQLEERAKRRVKERVVSLVEPPRPAAAA